MSISEKIHNLNLSELNSSQAREIEGGGVVPHDEEDCPVHDPDNPLDDYIIIH